MAESRFVCAQASVTPSAYQYVGRNRRQRPSSPLSLLFPSAAPEIGSHSGGIVVTASTRKRHFISYHEASTYPVLCHELDDGGDGMAIIGASQASPSTTSIDGEGHLAAVYFPLDGIGCHNSADDCLVVFLV